MSDTEDPAETSVTTRYHVYLYDLPKVDGEGQSIAAKPAETHDFTELEAARSFAAQRKQDFDRIVLIEATGESQQLVERFRDGEYIPTREMVG